MPRPATAAQVVDAVRELATRPGLVLVAVDGFGAAGKTTLAARIAAAVTRAHVVHLDDFAAPGIAEWDWPRFAEQVLAPLLRGEPARYEVSDWARGASGRWCEVPAGSVVVVEGVSATRREVDAPWDLTVWVAAPADVRLARARERDGAALLEQWVGSWLPSEQAWAARDRPQERVDLVVDGAG